MKHFKLEPSTLFSSDSDKHLNWLQGNSLYLCRSHPESQHWLALFAAEFQVWYRNGNIFWADNTASVYIEVNLAGTISDLTTSDDAPSNHEAVNSVTSSFRCNRWPASLIKNHIWLQGVAPSQNMILFIEGSGPVSPPWKSVLWGCCTHCWAAESPGLHHRCPHRESRGETKGRWEGVGGRRKGWEGKGKDKRQVQALVELSLPSPCFEHFFVHISLDHVLWHSLLGHLLTSDAHESHGGVVESYLKNGE